MLHPQALGIFGVLLFFVQTSLVLMFSMERQIQKTGLKHFYMTFLVRQIFRIYPLSIFVVLSMRILVEFTPLAMQDTDPLTQHMSARETLSNLLLIQNITHSPNSTGPLWSLPLEMQMYLLLPFLFLNSRKLGPRGILILWIVSVGLAVIQWKHLNLPDLLTYVPFICQAFYAIYWQREEEIPNQHFHFGYFQCCF